MDPDSSTSLFEFALSLHSVLRWAVVLSGALVLVQSLMGTLVAGELGALGKRLGLAFLIFLDLQVLLGIVIYVFLSPTTRQGMQDMGAAMKDPAVRFWVVEHGGVMILAVLFVHVGRILARRAKSERAAHLRRLLTTAIALGLIFLRTPWPFTAIERPWIRLPF